MKKRQSAGLTIRMILQWLAFSLSAALLAYLIGWSFYGSFLGLIFVLWSSFLGPFTFLLGYPILKKTPFIKPLQINSHPHLYRELFRLINSSPGPKLKFWVINTQDPSLFWTQGFFSQHQDLIIHKRWLEESSSTQLKQIAFVWNKIKQKNGFQSKIRHLQIACWASFFLPIDLVCYIFRQILKFLHVPEFSTPQFHIQRIAWKVFQFFFHSPFSNETSVNFSDSITPQHSHKNTAFHEPLIWSLLSFGVWSPISPSQSHPSWRIIMHRDAFLPL